MAHKISQYFSTENKKRGRVVTTRLDPRTRQGLIALSQGRMSLEEYNSTVPQRPAPSAQGILAGLVASAKNKISAILS